MVRHSTGKMQETLSKIHDMRVEGFTHEQIQKQLNIKPSTYYKVYIPKLVMRWRDIWEEKSKEEIYHLYEILGRRLNDCYQNAREKAREEGAHAQWGQLEEELSMLLNKFETQGLIAVLDGRFRQIEQKIRQNIGNEPAIIIKQQEGDDNRRGTISESSQSSSGSESDTERRRSGNTSQRKF